ncbi:MAG TPA: glycosyltransferase family 39 protein [Gemmatimonadota bacterium]|nr:glycosyltransferase family 39 protein [Gemmatimonadota bacterium]
MTQRGWKELLTTPLDYLQVAPVGFLAAEKLGVTILGNTEAGLRLFPYLASLAALCLYWRVSVRYLGRLSQIASVSLFALSPALLWYARNAKQYSGDVAVVLVLLLLALRMQEGAGRVRQGLILGFLGGVAILFSQPAVLVAAALGTVLLVQRWPPRGRLAPIAALGAGWFVGALIATVTSLMVSSQASRAFMAGAWEFAFFPIPWGSWRDFLWLPRRLLAFSGFFIGLFRPDTLLEVAIAGVYGGLALIGFPYLARRHPSAAALLFVPPVVAVLASIFRLLPLSGRLAIYMGPSLLLFSMAGLEQVRCWLSPKFHRGFPFAVVLLGLAPALILPFQLPRLNHRQPARLVLEEVRSQWRSGDAIYVQYGANTAMQFYGEVRGTEPWIAGEKYRGDTRAYLREVDVLRGRPRAWIFFTGSPRCVPLAIRSYLETIGTEVARIPDPYGNEGMNEAAAYLYALDDSTRAVRASAKTFPIPVCEGETRDREQRISESLKGFAEDLLR